MIARGQAYSHPNRAALAFVNQALTPLGNFDLDKMQNLEKSCPLWSPCLREKVELGS
jgi:hypothetical protein